MMKKFQEFPVLSGSRNGLPAHSWTRCRLEL